MPECKSTVQRVWNHNEIKPHRLETFKISNDPNFEEKFWDVIGLYLDPPERALVLCCDEKSQCQALERTQRPLPLKKGYTRTHDYIRHGTITLFAALSYLEGKIISRTEECHTHAEWLRFLKQIDRETPKELEADRSRNWKRRIEIAEFARRFLSRRSGSNFGLFDDSALIARVPAKPNFDRLIDRRSA